MTKNYCDRCEKEVEEFKFKYAFTSEKFMEVSEKHELCDDCYEALKRWLSDKPDVDV